jgi:UDP:flavonoid glycosyltransferase YjiC (YdhE family)
VTILFVAEAVTLAHVARPVSLARGLAAQGRPVVMAVDGRFDAVCPTDEWRTERIATMTTACFLEALRTGSPIHDRESFDASVAEDLALLARVRPAVVVGDFRLSLSVSARLAGVPYINISNAYWSPHARRTWHVPALPWTRFLPAPIGDLAFRAARPIAFRLHARGMEASRRGRGLADLGHDLLRNYTDGDITLYADPPELVPLFDAPVSHRHLGPVPWSPPIAVPPWWDRLDRRDGVVYVTLGSSGSAARLPTVLEGLARLGLPVVVATAGATLPAAVPANVSLAPYLPGDTIAAASRLVVCNGGSPTSHQALMHGVPVLALPSNLDQFLNSACLQDAGVGLWLRPQHASADAVTATAKTMLADATLRQRAAALAERLARHRPVEVLAEAIDALAPAPAMREARARHPATA